MSNIDLGDSPVSPGPTYIEMKQIQDALSIGKAGSQIYVDVNGNDATAEIGNVNFPFATIQEALNAASSGETVVVRSGVYDEIITLPDNVNLYMMPGAKIYVDNAYDSVSYPDVCFALRSEDGANCNVYGEGEFIVAAEYLGDNYSGTRAAVEFLGAGQVNFNAKRVQFIGTEAGSRTAIFCEKSGIINALEVISDFYDAFTFNCTNIIVNCAFAKASNNVIEQGFLSGYVHIGRAETTSILDGDIFNNFYGCAVIGVVESSATLGSIIGSAAVKTNITILSSNIPGLPSVVSGGEYCTMVVFCDNTKYTSEKTSIVLNSYANDAAADADATLPSKSLYKLNSGRTVYQKP